MPHARAGGRRRARAAIGAAGAAWRAALALGAGGLAAGCGGVVPGTPLPTTVGEPVVASTPVTGIGYQDEPSIAINPYNPANVVVAYQVPATVASSVDDGDTWVRQPLPGGEEWDLSGDPSVEFDADGRAYALYIAFHRPESYDTLGARAHHNGIFLNRSDSGGLTWWEYPTPVIERMERPGIPFEDKPMMGIDRSDDPARRGRIYVAWTEFRRTESVILFSRSADRGKSFSPPIEISDRAGSPKDSVGADEGTDVAVGPDGTVYVVWSDSTGIRLDRSRDRGATFGPDVLVARTPDIVFGVPGIDRAQGYPSLDVDARTGRLYVEWADGRLGATAVFLSTSDDGGATWSAPIPVSANSASDARDRFFAWMAVDAATGLVVVGYYRQEPDHALRYMLAWSADGGRTFRRRPWSERAFQPGGEFLGDYTGVSIHAGRAFAAWTEAVPGAAAGGKRAHSTRIVVGRAVFPVR